MIKALVYIHGFLSSPLSVKAADSRRMAEEAGIEFHAPDVNLPPREVDRLLDGLVEGLIEKYGRDAVAAAGSSLGGFYAARLANKHGLKAALFNPCIHPDEFVVDETGERVVEATGRVVEVLPSFADDFKALAREASPIPKDSGRTFAVLSTADEVLPWKTAYEALKDHCGEIHLSVGDDHRISKFREFIPVFEAFLKS